ncbi:hypothetical protein HKX48_003342 [Thoreauomyces humboldtii]|nr:hypothetical protein HKX48_003342 [Thoreauomyces humboldtii]
MKRLVWCFDDAERVRLLIQLVTEAPIVQLQIVAMVMLKDNVHACWPSKEETSYFSGRLFTRTFLSVLLDPGAPMYHNIEASGGLEAEEDLSRLQLVMHVLNLYLYVLLRDPPTVNETGVWDPLYVLETRQKLLPLKTKLANIKTGIVGLSSNQHVQHALGEPEAGYAHDELTSEIEMTVNMAELVLDQITERLQLGEIR